MFNQKVTKEIIGFVEHRRDKLGQSMDEIAKGVGVSRSTVSRIIHAGYDLETYKFNTRMEKANLAWKRMMEEETEQEEVSPFDVVANALDIHEHRLNMQAEILLAITERVLDLELPWYKKIFKK